MARVSYDWLSDVEVRRLSNRVEDMNAFDSKSITPDVHEASPPAHLQIPRCPVGPFIQALAARHGSTYVETASDRQAADFARLSDCAVELDHNERLLTALLRSGFISESEHDDLHDAYIRNDLGLE